MPAKHASEFGPYLDRLADADPTEGMELLPKEAIGEDADIWAAIYGTELCQVRGANPLGHDSYHWVNVTDGIGGQYLTELLVNLRLPPENEDGSERWRVWVRLTDKGRAARRAMRLPPTTRHRGPAASSKAKTSAKPSAARNAEEAIQKNQGDEWATVKQLAALRGKSESAIRSALNRASGKMLSQDVQDIQAARPGSPRRRYRIRAVWQYL